MNEVDAEISAIANVLKALASLPDEDARRRVLSYALSRFPVSGIKLPPAGHGAGSQPERSGENDHDDGSAAEQDQNQSPEIPGIAVLTNAGELRITARDLKAKSGLDAAVRLAHVAIYAHQKLTGNSISSRSGLTPLLQEWRLYDGNTRARLKKEKGILRDGDLMKLDAHARRAAETFIDEILDPSTQGSWSPK